MGIITSQNITSQHDRFHHIVISGGDIALPQILSDAESAADRVAETTPADVGIVAPAVEEPLGLSSGAYELFGNIQTSFSCEGRIYGYYANVELFCQIFHVCQPVTYADGVEETLQHNFFCPNQTVFDQSLLPCQHFDLAIPCEESEQYVAINEEFGKISKK